MGRTKIPYSLIQDQLEFLFPEPLYLNVEVSKERACSPTRIYGRSNGKYVPIGWKVRFYRRSLRGFSQQLMPIYEYGYQYALIEL